MYIFSLGLPDGHLFTIFVFGGLKGILFLFMHNTCPYPCPWFTFLLPYLIKCYIHNLCSCHKITINIHLLCGRHVMSSYFKLHKLTGWGSLLQDLYKLLPATVQFFFLATLWVWIVHTSVMCVMQHSVNPVISNSTYACTLVSARTSALSVTGNTCSIAL